jgi:hypothetical protein
MTTTKCAYIHTEIRIWIQHLGQRVSFSWTRPAPAAAGTHTAPDAADSDPEADLDMDTSVPTIMIPPLTSSIDLASHRHKRTFKSHPRDSQLQLRGARRHARLDPHTGFTSFHTPASSFTDGAHAEPFESALSSPLLAPLRPLHCYTLITIDLARVGDVRSCHRRYRYPPHPRSRPARYAMAQALARAMPPRPPRGPKLFFTSAKMGAGISDVFAYIGVTSHSVLSWEESRAEPQNREKYLLFFVRADRGTLAYL